MDGGAAQVATLPPEEAMTKSELTLERRISRLETLVWVLVALNLPEVLVLSEILI